MDHFCFRRTQDPKQSPLELRERFRGGDPLALQTLGQYQVLEKLGEGGMGIVYKARDVRLGRIVAIKCLAGKHITDLRLHQRFFQESRAASSLNHPNIVTVYELFTEGESDYLVMEYINGKTVERIISSKRLQTGELLEYAVQIADALAAAHASGIIHRDIKPSNVMVAEDRRIKVLDFGLAKVAEQSPAVQESSAMVVVGTQPRARAFDARATDVR
jgi:serine/threonine protein kinase